MVCFGVQPSPGGYLRSHELGHPEIGNPGIGSPGLTNYRALHQCTVVADPLHRPGGVSTAGSRGAVNRVAVCDKAAASVTRHDRRVARRDTDTILIDPVTLASCRTRSAFRARPEGRSNTPATGIQNKGIHRHRRHGKSRAGGLRRGPS